MHTKKTLKNLENLLIKSSFDSSLSKRKQSAAYSELNRLRSSRKIIELGFSEEYLAKELGRIECLLEVIGNRVDQYATNKNGALCKVKKSSIEKMYEAPLLRRQAKDIKFILID
tara:strand:+ start:295 stop:636 length:342 start_codon:yes stop_codon:yes gene_type:complete